MIFITVGTANKGFDRLIKKLDEIYPKLSFEMFAQIGNSSYLPVNFKYKRWLTSEEMIKFYLSAKIIISHAGFGTISEVLSYNKPLLIVPRKFEENEAVNNQNDLALKLDSLGYLKSISDINNLEKAIRIMKTTSYKRYKSVSNIPSIIIQYINSLI